MKPNLRILDKANELMNKQLWAAAPSDVTGSLSHPKRACA